MYLLLFNQVQSSNFLSSKKYPQQKHFPPRASQPYLPNFEPSKTLKINAMETLKLQEKGWKTPGVSFSSQEGMLEIKGKLMGNNTHEYFKPMLEWVGKYIEMPKKETIIKLAIEAITTSETKHLLDLLLLLKRITKKGNLLKIEWFFSPDDEDSIEMAENYQYFTKLPIELIEIHTESI